ncbi:hypothetical protein [Mucilaginibacter sp.]|uniref:hypothetical protein n=1 Tax=Mucilaginibacter sp. TaxID=1882438 RepID=UPI00262DD8C8|nr:hypothetical protein [Mucilaginibacter sp.]
MPVLVGDNTNKGEYLCAKRRNVNKVLGVSADRDGRAICLYPATAAYSRQF